MTRPLKIDKSLRERRRIIRLLDFLKRDDLTGDQMERIGRRLQKSGKRALNPLVRKLWREKNSTAIYRYTCMLDFFDTSGWMDQLIQITLQRTDLEEDGKLALLDLLHESGIDVTAPPFAALTGYGATTLEGFVDDCLSDGERGLVRFIDYFLDAEPEARERMLRHISSSSSHQAVELLEILLFFEHPDIVSEAVRALGRMKHPGSLDVLTRAGQRHEGEVADLIRRNIRRLSFIGIREPTPLPTTVRHPVPLYQVMAGPIDFYGIRTLWFSWKLEEGTFGVMLVLCSDTEGMLNATSYRMKNEKEYLSIQKELSAGEMLIPLEEEYALATLRDALHRSKRLEHYLPPDFYVDMRLFTPDVIKPEAYVPRFSLVHLEGIVEKIPAFVTTSNELLDEAAFEGWLLSEPLVYDVAEAHCQGQNAPATPPTSEQLEQDLTRLCAELIIPRRADIIKRLLLAADYLQQIKADEEIVQKALATALSLVGGFFAEVRHPFVRRLLLDSIDIARQALEEGYDMRLEEDYDDN